MLKKTIFVVLIAVLGAVPAAADIKKGQKTYLKKCKKCHGNGTKGAAMKSQDEWAELFEEDGEMIIEVHESTKAAKWFAGKGFKKKAQHLRDFLYHYANDSGNVPSCG